MPQSNQERTDLPDSWPRRWSEPCPLCGGLENLLYYQDRFRPYYRCKQCNLIFVPQPWQLDRKAEKARYDTHNNHRGDRGYRNYLSRIIPPLQSALNRDLRDLRGMDYGCGPGPVLAEMLEDEGAHMTLYDPYYFKNPMALEKSYDFITSTEVFEHMSSPLVELDRLLGLLKEKGILAVMTQLVTEKTDFHSWYYRNDETHISYFSRETIQWFCKNRDIRADFHGKDIIILRK